MIRSILALQLTLAMCQFVAANNPPVVNAGKDTTVVVGAKFHLYGSVSDDGLPYGVLSYHWTQIGGPDTGMQLLSLTSTLSSTKITGPGTFVFELWASDSELTAADTMAVTVLAALPFVVTTPQAGQIVRAGTTVAVTWQMDPPSSVNVNLSVNNGRTWTYLAGPVAVTTTADSWQWVVSDTLRPSDSCFIQIQYYDDHSKNAQSGRFSLVTTGVIFGVHQHPDLTAGSRPFGRFTLDGRHLDETVPRGPAPAARAVVISTARGRAGALSAVLAP